ncbi:MAG: hypothetical protein O3A36_01200 [bacterium]|nr:hypothetical protein [bacterium]
MEILDTIAKLLDVLVTVLIYFIIGFGPGFIVGVLLANRIFGKNLPLRMEKNIESIKKAAEHNSQWHPDHPKWK